GLSEVVSAAGLRQYHTAETEKYAHVTYFFNLQREEPFEGEDRRIVPSPKVATYDLKPEMSAFELTDATVARIAEGLDDFLLLNYANPDMVGHTGVLSAAVAACEAVDGCLGRLLEAWRARGGTAVVIADHGNAEQMLTPAGEPHTAHTTNPVPCVLVSNDPAVNALTLREGGALCDVAPTVLDLMGLVQPEAMTGVSLIVR
ncbi:MAG TPA: 2,3-bisphosphoglycerate-independent phosphoglycerate mutase, partial [Trueperaceae bacterium]|nr:2,3-bisphosphoglycerate-independent phosphoglycerate mutase [Trueperaceae bacterium]